jgi:hypothetical protein
VLAPRPIIVERSLVSVDTETAAQAQFDVTSVVLLAPDEERQKQPDYRHLARFRIHSVDNFEKCLTWASRSLSLRKQDAENSIPALFHTSACPFPFQLRHLPRSKLLRKWACFGTAANALLSVLIQQLTRVEDFKTANAVIFRTLMNSI